MMCENEGFLKQIFDPGSSFIAYCNKWMLLVAIFSLFLDLLFKYISVFNSSNASIGTDIRSVIVLSSLRSIADSLCILGIIVKFRTGIEAPGSKVFNRRILIKEPREIAMRYLRSTFIIDFLAALPLPQVSLWYMIALSSKDTSILGEDIQDGLSMIYALQLLPKLFVIFDNKRKITQSAGSVMKNAWSGACFNLLIYVILSNIVGASYYQQHMYWLLECRLAVSLNNMNVTSLGWDQMISTCTNKSEIEYGMFADGLTNKIGTRTFFQKYMFCFSWGLKSVSSLGQNFNTSFSTLETSASILINLFGLVLFADLITRMQAAIQSTEEKEEQHRARQQEISEWMNYHQLPIELRERVNFTIQSQWNGNGIDDELVLNSLPVSLQAEIRRHLYLDHLCKLPVFADMERQMVEAICQHLRTFYSREGTYIVYEGDLVRQMLFIFSGQLEISFTDRGNSSLTIIGPGEFCGQELITWAVSSPTSFNNLPFSTRTIKCLTDIEAFSLLAYDMKILATQFSLNQEFLLAFKQHYP